jgi:hypothetical protein
LTNMRGTALAAVLLVLASCGGSAGVTPRASNSPAPPSSTASASFPSPSPAAGAPQPVAVTCGTPFPGAGHELALLTLRNNPGVIVRDLADLSNPLTRCIIKGGGSDFRFYDSTHISYIVTANAGDGALYVIDLTTSATSLVRA